MYLVRIKQTFCATFGLLSLMVTLYALGKFILFTSKPLQKQKSSSSSLDGKSQELKVAVRHLVNNTFWLVVFILQHSLQKHDNVKKLWNKIGFQTIERSAYNLVSSFILLVRLLFFRFCFVSFALPGRAFLRRVINQIKLIV